MRNIRQKTQNVPTLFMPSVRPVNPLATDAKGPAGRSSAGAAWGGVMFG
jgi:hypothetical protein